MAACVAAAAVLTGCGVRGTDVVEAGGPATIAVPPSPGQRMLLLYFLDADDRPTPVARVLPAGDPTEPDTRPVSGAKALAALFEGPHGSEIAAGLHTELPRFRGDLQAQVSDEGVTVHVPMAARTLTPAAVRQIVCTASFGEGGGTAPVTIWGDDGGLPPARCQ
ncbi:hypothetical protein C3489_00760 [Streptomyces sp. Ru71]|nr:hypothetical protein C3489_00760 [Streptomyces sp. Ru71]